MKEKREWTVLGSVFRFKMGMVFFAILFWGGLALISGKPTKELWVQIGGLYDSTGPAIAFLVGVLCVLATVAVVELFFRKLEREADSYERKVSVQRSARKSLQGKRDAIYINLLMSDSDLLNCTTAQPLDFNVSGVWYQIPSYILSPDEIRSSLEKEKVRAEAELQAFVWPPEPLRIAKWRRRFAPRNLDATHA